MRGGEEDADTQTPGHCHAPAPMPGPLALPAAPPQFLVQTAKHPSAEWHSALHASSRRPGQRSAVRRLATMGVNPDQLMEEFDDCGPPTPPPVDGGKGRGRGRGRGRGSTPREPENAPEARSDDAQAKKKARTTKPTKANGKARNVKAGENERVCRTCVQPKEKSRFISQCNDCDECRLPLNNLRNLVTKMGSAEDVAWFNEYVVDPENRLKLIAQYNLRCPPNPDVPNGPRGNFPLMQYRKELQMEKAIIRDGIYEMMSEIAFQHWAAKPKNGGLAPADASAKWREKHDKPGAVTDLLGENPKYPQRLPALEDEG